MFSSQLDTYPHLLRRPIVEMFRFDLPAYDDIVGIVWVLDVTVVWFLRYPLLSLLSLQANLSAHQPFAFPIELLQLGLS